MANKLSVKPDGAQGRFSTAPTLAIARQIGSNDAASAASAASYRYEARVRELHARFENERAWTWPVSEGEPLAVNGAAWARKCP